MEQLQKLQAEIPAMSPEAQQAQAADLAQRYRNESDPILRAQIVRTIACCGSPAAGETLSSAARDTDRDVRIACCDAWAVHGGPQATPSLATMLRHDRSNDVRMAAARSLGRLSGPEVVEALAPALDDPDPALQYRAVHSLRKATGKDFGDNVSAWREFVHGGSPAEISTAQRLKLDYF
jgi:HEAT repeat protein